MKATIRIIVTAALIILVVTAIWFTGVETNKVSAIHRQNELLERHIVETRAQNDLLREEKMCIAFEQNRPDRQPLPAPPMQ